MLRSTAALVVSRFRPTCRAWESTTLHEVGDGSSGDGAQWRRHPHVKHLGCLDGCRPRGLSGRRSVRHVVDTGDDQAKHAHLFGLVMPLWKAPL
jgi:hypothetical protein